VSALALWVPSGFVDPLPGNWRVMLLASVAVLTIMRDWGIVHLRLPENRRQVPQTVFAQRPYRAALQFGFEMGTGVRTYLTATSPYLLAFFIVFAVPDLAGVLTAGAGFGIGRGILPSMRHLAPDEHEWDDSIDRWSSRLVKASAIMACGCTLALVLRPM
jgi:hypothetical protein